MLQDHVVFFVNKFLFLFFNQTNRNENHLIDFLFIYFFVVVADKRYPKVEKGLANCSWYEDDACCKRTEVASVFESMFTLHQASTQCRNMMNYLMCFFCAPDQYLWYIKK